MVYQIKVSVYKNKVLVDKNEIPILWEEIKKHLKFKRNVVRTRLVR